MAAPSSRRSRHSLASAPATLPPTTAGDTSTQQKRSSQRRQNTQAHLLLNQSEQSVVGVTRTLRRRGDKARNDIQEELPPPGFPTVTQDEAERDVKIALQNNTHEEDTASALPTAIPQIAKGDLDDTDSSLSLPSDSLDLNSDPVEESSTKTPEVLPPVEIPEAQSTASPPAVRKKGRGRPQKTQVGPIAIPDKPPTKSIRLTFKARPVVPVATLPPAPIAAPITAVALSETVEIESVVAPITESATRIEVESELLAVPPDELKLPTETATDGVIAAGLELNEAADKPGFLNTDRVSDREEGTSPEEPITPVRRKRGRPKGSVKKRRGSAQKSSPEAKGTETPSPVLTKANQLENMNTAHTSPAAIESPTPPVRRGPGRPRKSLLVAVRNADDEVGLSSVKPGGEIDAGVLNDGGSSGASTDSKIPSSPQGTRRSARERKSAVLPIPLIYKAIPLPVDAQAPVMGQGDLNTNRSLRLRARATAARAEWLENGRGEAAEAEDVERSKEARSRGKQTQKMEAERARRKEITTILVRSQIDTLPTFPAEYGFKVSYFRPESPPLSPTEAITPPTTSPGDGSPTPATTGSLPTPPITSEDESLGDDRPKKKQKVWTGELEEGYEPTKVLYTFTPTEEVFREFGTFIKNIGQVGRKAGVVRVTVPKACIPPAEVKATAKQGDVAKGAPKSTILSDPPAAARSMAQISRPPSARGSRSGSRSRGTPRPLPLDISPLQSQATDQNIAQLNCFHQSMKLHPKASNYQPIYSIRTTRVGTYNADEFLVQKDAREKQAEESPDELLGTEAPTEDIFLGKCIIEKKRHNSGIVYSTDNEATDELRSIFSLTDLNLVGFSGNSLFKSINTVAGIHTPYFYFANPASTFALHMEDYSALSINYHHWGAPKRWIVVCPADSEKLENLIMGMLKLQSRCDQFVRHESIFIPTKVLARAGIRYTEVEQQPGDMIVTFPWAYHQGWNQGLNIAEAIGYGDEGWEGWVRSYKICGKRCPVAPIVLTFPLDFGGGEGYVNGSEPKDGDRAAAEEDEDEDEDEASPLLDADAESNIDVDIGSDDEEEEEDGVEQGFSDEVDDNDDDDDDVDVDVELAGVEEEDEGENMDIDVDIGNESDVSDGDLQLQVQLQMMERDRLPSACHNEASNEEGNKKEDDETPNKDEATTQCEPSSEPVLPPPLLLAGAASTEEAKDGNGVGRNGKQDGNQNADREEAETDDVFMTDAVDGLPEERQQVSYNSTTISAVLAPSSSPLTQPPSSSPPPPSPLRV